MWVGWKYAPDGTVRVTIGGDLCYDTVGDLDGIDERLVPTPGGRVTLDLGSIEFIDSRGVTFVLRMRDAMIVHGARCEVISAAPLVRRVLTILELDRDLIPSCPRATRRQRR